MLSVRMLRRVTFLAAEKLPKDRQRGGVSIPRPLWEPPPNDVKGAFGPSPLENPPATGDGSQFGSGYVFGSGVEALKLRIMLASDSVCFLLTQVR